MQNIKEKFTNWPEWIKAIGIVISPLVALYIGNSFSDSIKDREIQTRYVELAISILREAPKPETQGLREWAVTTVNAYAKVPLAPDVRKELIEHRITGQASLPAESSECMRLPQNVERQIQSFSNDIGIEYCESRESVQGDLDGDLVKDLVVAISVYPCGKDANGSPVSCGNGAVSFPK